MSRATETLPPRDMRAAAPRPSERREHGARRLPRALALTALTALGVALAQPNAVPVTPEAPLIALHYQDQLASEPAFIDLFIPPPLVEGWDEFSYSAADCLQAQGVMTGPPGKAVIVRFDVLGAGCATRVELLFRQGQSTWPAAALVVVNRLPDLPPLPGLTPRFRSDRVLLPGAGVGSRPADLLLLGVENPGSEPLLIRGFGDDEAFAATFGQVFRYDPALFSGRYDDLLAHGAPFEPTALAPGESANFALVLDPRQLLPSGAATLTIRPVALVEVAGQLHTLEFPRLSSAWGTELP